MAVTGQICFFKFECKLAQIRFHCVVASCFALSCLHHLHCWVELLTPATFQVSYIPNAPYLHVGRSYRMGQDSCWAFPSPRQYCQVPEIQVVVTSPHSSSKQVCHVLCSCPDRSLMEWYTGIHSSNKYLLNNLYISWLYLSGECNFSKKTQGHNHIAFISTVILSPPHFCFRISGDFLLQRVAGFSAGTNQASYSLILFWN